MHVKCVGNLLKWQNNYITSEHYCIIATCVDIGMVFQYIYIVNAVDDLTYETGSHHIYISHIFRSHNIFSTEIHILPEPFRCGWKGQDMDLKGRYHDKNETKPSDYLFIAHFVFQNLQYST
jgi:hypothetical protein